MYDYPPSRYRAAPAKSEVFAGLAPLSLCMALLHAVGTGHRKRRVAASMWIIGEPVVPLKVVTDETGLYVRGTYKGGAVMGWLVRWLLMPLGILVVLLLLGWLGIRQYSAYHAFEVDAVASGAGNCTLKSYIRNYKPLGPVGRIGSGYSSRNFYRVYDSAGDLLATSEWNFSEYEIDDFSAHWIRRMAMYPTTDGWASFSLKQCDFSAEQQEAGHQ